MATQQNDVKVRREAQQKQQGRVRKSARAMGIRADLLDDSAQTADAVALMAEARREHESETRGAGIEETTTGES